MVPAASFPPLQKNARTGHPLSRNGKRRRIRSVGHPPHSDARCFGVPNNEKVAQSSACNTCSVASLHGRNVSATHRGVASKKAVDHVFYEYTRALLDQRWNDAYTFSSEDFRLRTSPQAFVNQHQELIQRFGKLQSVKQGHTVVEGKGTPSVWVAEIHAEFRFDTKAIGLVYWFRPTDGDWKLVGYRVEE